MKTKLFIFGILFQLILIMFFGVQIINKINKKNVSVTYIDKNNVNIKGTQSLKYFYELKPGITKIDKRNWLAKDAVYTYNKDALNERFDYQIKKPKDVFRIITLGDSFTFGIFVNTEANWTELLEDQLNNSSCKKFNKYEVINLGVHGYDIAYEVERYKIRGQKYNPDLLIWMLVDSSRINELMREFYLSCMKISPSPSLEKQNYHYCFRNAVQEVKNTKGINTIHQMIGQEFKLIFDIYGNKIVVVDLNDKHREILKNFNKEGQIDIYKYDFINPELRLPDGHPNEKGHQKIAKDVFDYLTKNKIIPCN